MRGDAHQPGADGRVLSAAGSGGVDPERIAALAIVATYAGALALLPWLSPGVRLGAAAAVAVIALLAWTPADGRAPGKLALAGGAALHLAILGTGALASPLLVGVVPWLGWSTLRLGARGKLFAGGGSALALAATDAWARGGFARAGVAEALLVVACAVGVGGWVQRLDRRVRAGERALARILDEAESGRDAGEAGHAARRLDELAAELERVRKALGAAGAVLWDVDPETERARPRLGAGGATPAAVPLRGDPLGWAWEEGLALRLENAPPWADGAASACVVPLEPRGARAALLTLAFGAAAALPDADALEAAGDRLRALLHAQHREAMAVASRERFALVMQLLRRLPGETAPDAFARQLAAAAMRLIRGTGAAVATWAEETGVVLAVAGDDGGPDVGATFGPVESEMALAARHAATLARERLRRDARPLPVAAAGERWHAEPGALAIVPLTDAGHGVAGVLAVWNSGPEAFDPEAVELLETLAPYAGIQLDQAKKYGALREHAERDALTGLANRRTFEARLRAEGSYFQRYGRAFSLVLLDVDHFKRINDTYGHEAGDAVLRAVAACIAGSVREVDLAARYGGEEFALLLPETPLAGARETAERLRRRVEDARIDWRGQRIDVRISLGVSAVPECVADPSTLVRSADAALYASKEGGRNRVTAAPLRG